MSSVPPPPRARSTSAIAAPTSPLEQTAHQDLGGVEREAVHRTRHVEEEDVLARRDLLGRRPLRRLHHQREKILRLRPAPLPQQETALDLVPGQPVAEHEVAVAAARPRQLDVGAVRRRVAHRHLVRRRGQLLDPDPGLEVNLDVEPIRLRRPSGQVRVRHPLVFRWIRPAGVARPDDRWVDELVGGLVGHQHLGVVHLHRDAIARHDVGDVHGEDVGALLLEQRRPLPLASRRLVAGASGRPPIDLRLDHPPANLHPHPVHSRSRRSGEHIHRLDRRLPPVLEQLMHLHAGNDAGDRHVR
jgi:hypothetical protein